MIEPGTPVSWVRKFPGKRRRTKFVGCVTGNGDPGWAIVAINGSAYEVKENELRALKKCLSCGGAIDSINAYYCSRRCHSDMRLADTRRYIFEYLVQYKAANDGLSPTVRDIVKATGVDVVSTVKHLKWMAEDGMIWFVGDEHRRLIGVRGGRWTFEVRP